MAMAECCTTPVGCLKEIGKNVFTQCLWPPMKRHIDYWWCFDNNIQVLRDAVRDLDREIFDINQKIEEARLQIEELRPGVEDWANSGSKKLAEARTILQGDNIPKSWNLISRYSMGKNAKKAAEEIAKHQNDGNFNAIADRPPPPARGFTPYRSAMDFESRKRIEEDIIKSLKKSSVGMIGICGMGGVGKTTMAQRIRERVMKENLFEEVVMVVVSQQIDTSKIQEEIAELLGLKFDVKSPAARAQQLCKRLMTKKKKIIIFDDVWESLKFEDLGITFESDSDMCKVLLTSRSKDTCKGIKNIKVFELKILDEKEAWILFKEKVGQCVDDSALNLVAKEVAAECKGLPIALVTVGTALQDETDKRIWDDSLSKLRRSNPTDFEEVLERVYNPLKLSYDYLATDSQRQLFLLCCLFPEDYDISIELLTLYSMGLRLFGGMSSIEEARNRTHGLVGKLKSRFLLIDGWKKLHVKMHDVVRDVAIYIGSKEKNVYLKSLNNTSIESSSDVNCKWMSVDISNEQMEIPVASRFPNLRLLMLLKSSSNEFSDISFQGMKDVNVLSFPSTWIGSLPPSLGLLKDLQTLCLFKCVAENISVIGELKSLEIFRCNGCKNIVELPAEIGRLNRLRLLDLNECSNLRRIPFGILSSLVRLEELKMLESFDGWEAEENGKEMRNASLTELECLPNLTCLEIQISDSNLAARELRLSPKLVKYRLYIAAEWWWHKPKDHENFMKLKLPSGIGAVGKWIQILVKKTEWLYLEGDGSNNINLEECQVLRNLEFKKCSRIQKLVKTEDCKSGIVYPLLDKLLLCELENLEEICDGTIILNQNVSLFCNLKSVESSFCSNLRYLFTVSVARRCLLQIEVIEIRNCEAMEQVFRNEIRDDTDSCIEFPKLKTLTLKNLPNLTAFCQGVQNIKFPKLTQLKIGALPKLNSFSPLDSETPHDDRTLFSVSVARRCLLQLEVLEIIDCEAMEQVFRNEIRDDTDGCIEFPKLKKLNLQNLPNLTAFCQGVQNIKFPYLKELEIGDLPKLNSLCPLDSETPHDDTTPIHFLCNPKVEMSGLKCLKLIGWGDNIWCDQIPMNFFNNLQQLIISEGVRSSMPYSIAKNIVSLQYLHIFNCKEMVEVIEGNEDDKEVVDIKCLFPALTTLYIWNSHKLRRFWQWNHALELPLLENVHIINCPVMETFTSGYLNTPNLKWLTIDNKAIDHKKDLNDVIHHRFRTESQNTSMIEEEEEIEDANKDEDKDDNKIEYNNANVNEEDEGERKLKKSGLK